MTVSASMGVVVIRRRWVICFEYSDTYIHGSKAKVNVFSAGREHHSHNPLTELKDGTKRKRASARTHTFFLLSRHHDKLYDN